MGADELSQIVIFRLMQGAAGAAMLPSSQAIMMETFPLEEQQLAMATWGVGMMVAPILGPTLGGWITDNWNWRWNFYMNIPVGAIALVMVSIFVHDPPHLREHRARGGRVDYRGILLLFLSLGLLQIVVDRGQRSDWFSAPWVVWAAVASLCAMVYLVFHELHFRDPIIDLRILKLPLFSISVCIVVALSFILWGTGLLGPVFLQEFMGYTAQKAGLVMVPRAMGAMCAMFFAGQVARAGYDNKRLIGVSFTMMATGLWAMSGWNLGISMWQVIWPGIILGAGLGLCFPITMAAAFSVVPQEKLGFAASLYNMVRNTGAAVGIAYMTNTLVSHQQIHQSYLVEHFSVFEAWRLGSMPHRANLPALGYLPQMISGHKQGFGLIYGTIQAQSSMLAFNDIYRILTAIAIVMIPSFLILKGAKVTRDKVASDRVTGDAIPAH